jgi:flagellar biosynthesis protein FlhF
MRIKRYFAADMRQAIRLVREEQGPDAVILSNRQVNGGVEIVAALDYDEEAVAKMAAVQSATVATEHSPLLQVEDNPAPGIERAAIADTPEAIRSAGSRAAKSPAPEIVWSQEPSLVAMREEIKNLRGILENQLSGLAWGELRHSHPLYTRLLERLMQLGLSAELCRAIADRLSLQKDEEQNWRQALGMLAAQIPLNNDDILSHSGIVALVGPTGVGKTTSVAKLAARYTLRHGPGKVALVTTDSYRIGAYQQLRTYGQILGAPVYVVKDEQELHNTLKGLRDKPLVLIDTAGMSQHDVRLTEQLSMLCDPAFAIRHYLVLSATTQRAALDEATRVFARVKLDGAILTKLDESALPGEVLSVIIRHALPLSYISDGQRVPEDLHPARANNLVNRSVKMMRKYGEIPSEEGMALAFGQLAREQ